MARIEFVVARIFKLGRPGLVRVGLGGRAFAIEAFRVGAWSAENRIALGAAIDGGNARLVCLSAPFGSLSSSAANSSGSPTA